MSRLPIPGSDDNVWGQILNDFLSVSNNPDGTLQPSAITEAGGYLKPSTGIPLSDLNASTQSIINTVASKYTVPAGGIPSSDMSAAVQAALNTATASVQSVNSKTPVGGNVNIATTDLTDTAIVVPTNNQILAYDGTSGKWVNQTPGSGVGLDSNAADIQPLGVRAAGSTGLAADAGHIHAMPTLNQIDNPTGSVSMNSQKLTNLANGSLATDAAAFGQIPTVGAAGSGAANALSADDPTTTNSRTPNGSAGGDLSGSYPDPTVVKLNGAVSVPGTNPGASGLVLTTTGSGTTTAWQTPASAPVTSVFGRAGEVTAQSGDYTAGEVGALPATDDLSAIANANATAGSVSLNSHKITNLANGSLATDAAAFGQIPTSLSPSGSAGGDLSGSYPDPTLTSTTNVETIISNNPTVAGALQAANNLSDVTNSTTARQNLDAAEALVPTAVQTGPYSANPGDFVPVDASSGSVTVTLPTAPDDKSVVSIKMINTNTTEGYTVTINTGGSDVLNKAGGSTSTTLSLPNQAVTMQYDLSTAIWYIADDDLPLGSVKNIIPDWFNVKSYGATGNNLTDDTAAIQAALNAANTNSGGTVYFPAGNYIISSVLTVYNNTVLLGGSLDQGNTIIKQTSTTANGITASNVVGFKMENLYVYGPSSGSGIGVALTTTGSNISQYVTLRNCRVAHFGSDGINVGTPIVSTFDRVISLLNGGHGFNIGGSGASGGTSCAFTACYANSNQEAGYYLNNLQYSSLSGCASDANGTGYYLSGCIAIGFHGCGTESNVDNSPTYNGNGFVIYGGSAIGIYSCFVYQNPAISYWVTNAAESVELSGCTDSSPTGTATYSIKYDTSCTGSVVDAHVASATSYVPQINILNDNAGNMTVGGGLTVKGSAANSIQLIDASLYTHTQVQISTSGYLAFGPGSTTVDTYLRRLTSDSLSTDGAFTAGTSVTAPIIYGSTAASANLQITSTSSASLGQILVGSQAAFDGVSGSIQLGSSTLNIGSGAGVVGISNATTIPSTNPTNGGILYSSAGLPVWRDSNGNVYDLSSGGSLANTPLPDDQNLLAWAFDPATATSGTAPTAGVLQLIRVILRSNKTVSTIYLDINATVANGTALTSGENLVGLYNSSGSLIDSCGDQTTAWGTAGFQTANLGSSHALSAGTYYVGFLMNASGGSPYTPPTFARTNGLNGVGSMINVGLTPATYRFAVNGSGLTALPGTITMTSNGFPGVAYWAAIA